MIKQQMLRSHRTAGHPSFQNLQRLLRARNAPAWSIELAGNLKCLTCLEARRPLLSFDEAGPDLVEIVGTDISEFEHGEGKHKLIIWRDRASGYILCDHLHDL